VIDRYTQPNPPLYTVNYTVDSTTKKKIVNIYVVGNVSDARVRVFRLAQDVTVDVRYTLVTRPFAAVLDSSKYFTVEADNLIQAGFVPQQHWTVMTKEEVPLLSLHCLRRSC